MKYTSFRDFSAYLEKLSPSDLPSSLVLQGSDFDAHEAFCLFKECCLRLLGQKAVTFATAQDAEQINALLSPSLFASTKTVVVIENFEKLKGREQERLKHFLARPSRDILLVLKTASYAATEIGKLVAATLTFPEEKPWDKETKVANWVVAFCKSWEVAISQDLANWIARECGQDRFFLQKELEKLLVFMGERKRVQPQDLEAILTIEPKSSLWNLSDAYMQKNGQEAISILQQLEQQEVHYFVIVRHLRHALHQALEMHSLADAGVALADIASRYPQLKGKMFEKAFQRAKAHNPSFLANALVSIDKAESTLKDSPFDEQMVLIKFLVHTL